MRGERSWGQVQGAAWWGCAQHAVLPGRCTPGAPCLRALRSRPCPALLAAADRVESALQERARLEYTREVLANTKSAAQRLRFALAASGLANGVLQSARHFRRAGDGRGGRLRGAGGGGDDDLLGA